LRVKRREKREERREKREESGMSESGKEESGKWKREGGMDEGGWYRRGRVVWKNVQMPRETLKRGLRLVKLACDERGVSLE
jgi:hypothetical protein